ncbi:hypothetical protein ACFPM0_09740 [Pseudonocardia sulfidoxydans]
MRFGDSPRTFRRADHGRRRQVLRGRGSRPPARTWRATSAQQRIVF